ncbi:hypothetical protein Tco_1016039 [Tanacetum coccineum]|uniref:Uncharacterized protein n=1 Tax=Tanacetum coccineum TaxID=301880 RepID=A0ABQ5FMZ3_9ASTR
MEQLTRIFFNIGGNNAEASGGSGVSAVIGLSAAAGDGGALVQVVQVLPVKPASQPSTIYQVPVSETRNADGREMGDGVPTQSSATGGAISDNGNFPIVDKKEVTSKKLAPMAEELIMLIEVLKRNYISPCDSHPPVVITKNMSAVMDNRLGSGGYLMDYVRVITGTNDGGGGGYLRDYVRVVGGMNDGAVEQEMDANVPDEIDGAKGEQVPNHVVKKGNLEFLVCKEVSNPGVNQLVDKGRPIKRKRVYAE